MFSLLTKLPVTAKDIVNLSKLKCLFRAKEKIFESTYGTIKHNRHWILSFITRLDVNFERLPVAAVT